MAGMVLFVGVLGGGAVGGTALQLTLRVLGLDLPYRLAAYAAVFCAGFLVNPKFEGPMRGAYVMAAKGTIIMSAVFGILEGLFVNRVQELWQRHTGPEAEAIPLSLYLSIAAPVVFIVIVRLGVGPDKKKQARIAEYNRAHTK